MVDIMVLKNFVVLRALVWGGGIILVTLTVHYLMRWFQILGHVSRLQFIGSRLCPFMLLIQIYFTAPKNRYFNSGCVQSVLGIGYISTVSKKLAPLAAYIGYHGNVLLSTPDAAEAVFKSSQILRKSFVYGLLEAWLGTGLLTANERKWKDRRRLLTPAFHFKLLDDFLPIMNDHAFAFVRHINKMNPNKPFDITSTVSCCTLDIICETAMGVNFGALDDTDSTYVRRMKNVAGAFLRRIVVPLYWSEALFYALSKEGFQVKQDIQYLHDMTEQVIVKRRQDLEETGFFSKVSDESGSYNVDPLGKRRLAFLDILLASQYADPETWSMEGIREEVDTFMFEGHDTTAMGISFTLYLLGLHRDIQEKVIAEIDTVFGDDKDRSATVDDLKKLKYLECCLKESHRLYPPVPFIAREVTTDIELDGAFVPKGAHVDIFIYTLHRQPKYWDKPEEFIPERFLPENSAGRHPYAFVPFAAGHRNCIGQRFALQEEKIVLSTILRNFKLYSPLGRETLRLNWELIMRPEDGLLVQFIPRK